MLALLEYLKKKLHDRIPHSQLIWYDSVIPSGQLQWQNQLNDLNK